MAYALASRLERAVKKSGLKYKKVSGWASRGHGTMGSIQTIVPHHTAGPRSGNTPSLNVVTYGRPGLSGPLAQIFLARDGTVYLCAAGIAYHAGRVRSNSYSNSHSIGIEAENTGLSNDSPWPSKQMNAYAKLCRALCAEFKLPTSRVLGHKEICSPPRRKSDPSFNMSAFRKKVAGAKGGVGVDLGGSGGTSKKFESANAKHTVGSRTMGMYDGGTDVNWLQRRMYKIGYKITPKSDGTFDSLFGTELKAAVKALQAKAGLKEDGLAGEKTIAAAQAAKAVRKLPTVKKKPAAKKKPTKAKAKLVVDGVFGRATKKALQKALGVTADGIIGAGTIRALQKRVGAARDGIWGRDTTRRLQRRLGVKADGKVGPVTIKALQSALNAGKL